MVFLTKTNLIKHLSDLHGKKIEACKTMQFKDEASFLLWKENEEESTMSYFPRAVGSQQCGDTKRNYYYYCKHDGSNRSHVKKDQEARKTSRKVKIGQVKRNFTCMAKMVEIIKEGGNREVIYSSTHNHVPCMHDIVHQLMPKSTSDLINTQISLNVGPKEKLKSVQGNVDRESRHTHTHTHTHTQIEHKCSSFKEIHSTKSVKEKEESQASCQ
jgi:hypothetical protein